MGKASVVRLYLTVPKKKDRLEIVTPYMEQERRRVTDPQDGINKFGPFILHCYKNDHDFEWPMSAATRIRCGEFDLALRDADPIVKAPPEFYKKEHLKAPSEFGCWRRQRLPGHVAKYIQ